MAPTAIYRQNQENLQKQLKSVSKFISTNLIHASKNFENRFEKNQNRLKNWKIEKKKMEKWNELTRLDRARRHLVATRNNNYYFGCCWKMNWNGWWEGRGGRGEGNWLPSSGHVSIGHLVRMNSPSSRAADRWHCKLIPQQSNDDPFTKNTNTQQNQTKRKENMLMIMENKK